MENRGLRRLGRGWRGKLAAILILSLLISLAIAQGISTAQQEVYLSSGSMRLDANDPIDPTKPIDQPVGTHWHELYPNFCDGYDMSGWHDDNNDNVLSPCDQIELTNNVTQASAWYHVDAMTITIWVKPAVGGDIYLEWDGGYTPYNPDMLGDVLYSLNCTLWHEVYPEFCNWYHLETTIDNGDGHLSECDEIVLVDIRTGEWAWYHVEGVTTDIIVSPKPIPPDPIPNPVCTYWHEIYPQYCRWYHLSDWVDNGDDELSPCDTIELTNLATQVADSYHVDEVTLTMWVTNWSGLPPVPGETSILEFEGGYNNMGAAMATPVCTNWHEIHPQFSNRYHIEKWEDNGDDKLSFCDWIYLDDLGTNATEMVYCHVDGVATNIVVTPEEPEPGPDCGAG